MAGTDHPRMLVGGELLEGAWLVSLCRGGMVLPSSTVSTLGWEARGRRGFSREGAEEVFHLGVTVTRPQCYHYYDEPRPAWTTQIYWILDFETKKTKLLFGLKTKN